MGTPIKSRAGHKYVLVEESTYKALKDKLQSSELKQSPEFTRLKTMDSKIQEILEDKSIPNDIKAKLYAAALAEFLDLRERAPELQKAVETHKVTRGVATVPPIQVETATEPVREETPMVFDLEELGKEEINTSGPQNILKNIEDPQQRRRAENILNAMKNKRRLPQVDDEGNVTVGGRPISRDNFLQILDYISRKHPENMPKPRGTDILLQRLGEANVNPLLIKNPDLKAAVIASSGSSKKYFFRAKPLVRYWHK